MTENTENIHPSIPQAFRALQAVLYILRGSDKSTVQRKSTRGESRGPHTLLSDPPSHQHN